MRSKECQVQGEERLTCFLSWRSPCSFASEHLGFGRVQGLRVHKLPDVRPYSHLFVALVAFT